MIDTSKFISPITSAVADTLLNAMRRRSGTPKLYGTTFYVAAPFGKQPNLRVTFSLSKKTMSFELSLAKWIQGHNVFGRNNLSEMYPYVIMKIYEHLGVPYDDEEQAEIERIGVRLGRIDLACNFLFSEAENIKEALSLIQKQVQLEGCKWAVYGSSNIESVYKQINSERISDKFYYKGAEVGYRQIPEGIPNKERIIRFANRCLRFEVTIRAKELVTMGMTSPDDWNLQRVKEVLAKRLRGFNFIGSLTPAPPAKNTNDLKQGSQLFYHLWKQGANFSEHRVYRTLRRAREQILESVGVDIFRPLQSNTSIPLSELLDPKRARYSIPGWAK